MCFLFVFVVVLVESALMLSAHAVELDQSQVPFNRSSFPKDFLFGAASSAYQYEGAANEGGRGPSIWDTFTHTYPGKIRDGSNGDVADDSYHRYKEDVGLAKDIGFDAYRFSISWSRVLPRRKAKWGVNREGIQYYNNLINELLSKGIKPFATLFHWDLPQALEDAYSGFLSPLIVDDFQDYAELCFKEFGDRVKSWITFNEPWTLCNGGYTTGAHAPGRCSPWLENNCGHGDSAREPYMVAHHQLLAHAAAVKLYREKYKESQKGIIGITVVVHWIVPYSNNRTSKAATQRAIDFMLGWFMDPLTHGTYPASMKSRVGNRMPDFTEEQIHMVNGSFDFLGLNYYTANYAAYAPPPNNGHISYATDANTLLTTERNGVPIGPKGASPWLFMYPRGIQDLLLYIKRKYNNPVIYITENGIDELNNSTMTLEEALTDNLRIEYYYKHLQFLHNATNGGVDLRGFFAWSLLDNFEWGEGYTVRFGLNYVDYKNGLKRYPKHSATWFKKFLQK
ncbi:hypothetical protein Scep_013830 [Stephania cephalantha]|uniref:Beta-glucosidase n=1 Tax=Stephania cephalantha TaxID=152367 RepID=A0AAP0J053_9MAGN